jgi:hypothetical protein
MVNFSFIQLPDPRLTPDIKSKFLSVGQLIKWELTDSSGIYTGLVIVGEKSIPQGFQTMADITFDIGDKEIPVTKFQEISRIVLTEFQQRGVVTLKKPPSTK